MDAQFYQSITGLTNYEGFKSLLKNSTFGNRGNVEDENLIFVGVQTICTSNPTYSLKVNQVAVILNVPFAAFYVNNALATLLEDSWGADDVNANLIQFIGEAAKGICVTGTIFNTTQTPFQYTCQFAIFELY